MSIKIHRLHCQFQAEPIGLDVVQPLLSWSVHSLVNLNAGLQLTVYKVNLLAEVEKIWQWGSKDASLCQVIYNGPALASYQKYEWLIELISTEGKVVASAKSFWQMGILSPEMWSALWLSCPKENDHAEELSDRNSEAFGLRSLQNDHLNLGSGGIPDVPLRSHLAPIFSKIWEAPRLIARATAFYCGLGYGYLRINGEAVSEEVLPTMPSSFDKRVYINAVEVTKLLQIGTNEITLEVGNGFYGQNLAFRHDWFHSDGLEYGKPMAICQIHVEYWDGEVEDLVSDGSWTWRQGTTVFDNLYAGETVDARRELPLGAQFSHNVELTRGIDSRFFCHSPCAGIKTVESFDCKMIRQDESGRSILDVGQNIAGWAVLEVTAPEGSKFILRYAERLTSSGELDPRSTGVYATRVVQSSIYTAKGVGTEIFRPKFSYHAFRYIELTAPAGTQWSVRAEKIRSELEPCGSFESSLADLNEIYLMAKRTIEGNLHGLIEDCPGREKCGWLGDAHVSAEVITMNYNTRGLWDKIMADIYDNFGMGKMTFEGKPTYPGLPTNVAPGKRVCQEARPDWGLALIFIPWYAYLYHGDDHLMRKYFNHMSRFMNHIGALTRGNILYHGYGDWCPPEGTNPVPVELTTTALYFRALELMQKMASHLGQKKVAQKYGASAQDIKESFIKHFFISTEVGYGSQTGNAMAMAFGLYRGEKSSLLEALVHQIEVDQYACTCGIHGMRYLYTQLSQCGRTEVVLKMFKKKDYPSMQYFIERGHTTLMEKMMPVEKLNDSQFDTHPSMNHQMNANFAIWFHESALGIQPDEQNPGFKSVLLQPCIPQRVSSARGYHTSPLGRITSEWRRTESALTWNMSIPYGSKATVFRPLGYKNWVMRVDGTPFNVPQNEASLNLACGNYSLWADII